MGQLNIKNQQLQTNKAAPAPSKNNSQENTGMKHGEPEPGSQPARSGYYRMFDLAGTRFKREALLALAKAQGRPQEQPEGSKLPAGYTYFGQFVDHDITRLARGSTAPESGPVPTADLVQEATPALDLDSVYGADWHERDVELDRKTGKFTSNATDSQGLIYDLPRGRGRSGLLARIPDRRNDENFNIAQLHVFFLNLHKALIDIYSNDRPELTPQEKYLAARREVVLLYQGIVKYDFLQRILHGPVYQELLKPGSQTWLSAIRGEDARIPIEFAGAAYRFGHALVRKKYQLKAGKKPVKLRKLFLLTGNGGRITPAKARKFRIDWRFFFDFTAHGISRKPIEARPVTTFLVRPLQKLVEDLGDGPNLIVRNLLRGREIDLPDAQSIIAEIRFRNEDYANSIGLQVLNPGELRKHKIGETLAQWGMDKRTPLWTYILMEPSFPNGQFNDDDVPIEARLGILGSVIVGEVFRSLLITSSPSICFSDESRLLLPGRLGKRIKDIQLADLIQYAHNYREGDENGDTGAN